MDIIVRGYIVAIMGVNDRDIHDSTCGSQIDVFLGHCGALRSSLEQMLQI